MNLVDVSLLSPSDHVMPRATRCGSLRHWRLAELLLYKALAFIFLPLRAEDAIDRPFASSMITFRQSSKVELATDVAETAALVPGIMYVVDAGVVSEDPLERNVVGEMVASGYLDNKHGKLDDLEFIAKAQFVFKVISLFKELEESRLVSLPLLLQPVLVPREQSKDDKDGSKNTNYYDNRNRCLLSFHLRA
nr:unnamed protein product [Digitaria exilis]